MTNYQNGVCKSFTIDISVTMLSALCVESFSRAHGKEGGLIIVYNTAMIF